MEFDQNVHQVLKKCGNSNRKEESRSFWAESSLIAERCLFQTCIQL